MPFTPLYNFTLYKATNSNDEEFVVDGFLTIKGDDFYPESVIDSKHVEQGFYNMEFFVSGTTKYDGFYVLTIVNDNIVRFTKDRKEIDIDANCTFNFKKYRGHGDESVWDAIDA
jgi:hypothetical protein